GACTTATQLFKAPLPTGQKVWATPVVLDDKVFFATAGTTSVSVCAAGDGKFVQLSTSGDGTSPTTSNLPSAPTLTGAPAASLKLFDGHIMVNTIAGQTNIYSGGAGGWNNARPTRPGSG